MLKYNIDITKLSWNSQDKDEDQLYTGNSLIRVYDENWDDVVYETRCPDHDVEYEVKRLSKRYNERSGG